MAGTEDSSNFANKLIEGYQEAAGLAAVRDDHLGQAEVIKKEFWIYA